MIRFINLTDQITDDVQEFAFFDTVTATFCTFSGVQTWRNVDDFITDYDGDELQRYLTKIPDEFR